MSDVVRASKPVWLTFDQIELPDKGRPYNAASVSALAESIRTIGLQSPLTVIERDGRFPLVAGRHRLEALRVIGEDRIPCRVVDLEDEEARLWTIAENLHRTELTALQRSEQIEEWRKLTAEKKGGQPLPPSGGAQPHDAGISATARDLGITREEVRRAHAIASLPDKVKSKAADLGLADNQRALLQAAKAPPKAQVKALERAAAPAPARPPQPKPLHSLDTVVAWELARWIKATTPDSRTRVVRMLRMTADILEAELQGDKRHPVHADA